MSASDPTTYLDLCQRLAQEAGVDGDPAMSTVAGQTGELKRCCDWVNDALREILGLQKWTFLWENAALTLPLGVNTIAGTIPASRYDLEQTWMTLTGATSPRNLDYVPWQDFSTNYQVLQSPGSITAWSIQPDNTIVFNAVSTDAAGTPMRMQRFKLPTRMVADTDEPPIPADLRMLIVWTALKKYAGYDEAGGQREIAVDEARTMKEALYERCLQQLSFGAPLIEY